MRLWTSCCIALLAATTVAQIKSPTDLRQALAAKSTDAAAMKAMFKGDFANGVTSQSGVDLAFAIERPWLKSAAITSGDGTLEVPLQRIGNSDLFVGVATVPHGTGLRYAFLADGIPTTAPRQLEAYIPDPDMAERHGVPKGDLIAMPPRESVVYKGTKHNWWLYVPKQYDAAKPAAVMFFQDGQWAKSYVPTAFDNLIAKQEMPVTVGIFIEPGTFADGKSNRSFEYDRITGDYAKFLIDEVLPDVAKQYNLRSDAAGRAIAGLSSGGVCAFTAAWQRPDQIGKVMSWIGSFVDLARLHGDEFGGDDYPSLIRKTDPKPIRVFLQDGRNDLDNPFGNWPLSNQQMERALSFKGYDVTFVFGNGFHSDAHGRSILPMALRWLWRGEQ